MTLEEERKAVAKSQRNKENFRVLYDYYHPKIYSYIYRKLGRKEISEDLTSITFEKALRRLNDYQWQGISFGVWLYRIARNNINDYLRGLQRRREGVSLDDMENLIVDEDRETHIEAVIRSEEEDVLYKAIGEFDENDQFLLYYKFFEDMTNKEIAKRTGLSETNVGTKLHRLRQKLKATIIRLNDKDEK